MQEFNDYNTNLNIHTIFVVNSGNSQLIYVEIPINYFELKRMLHTEQMNVWFLEITLLFTIQQNTILFHNSSNY